jgi:hypothetical protein
MLKSESLKSEPQRSVPLKSVPSKSSFILRTAHARVAALCLLAGLLALPSLASAQNFTLQAAAMSPDAVPPGGTSSSNITIGTDPSFTGTVDLVCVVTPSSPQTIVDPPACTISPSTVTPPASASATITTQGLTTTVSYNIAITGTAASTGQVVTASQTLTVLAITPQFTITIQKAVVPSSVPAGSGGEGTININPINGYVSPQGTGITLSCSSITPLVTIPPVCSFNPATVALNGTLATSTLTISTYGPVTTGAAAHSRTFYSLWMPLPMLALVGLGAAVGGKRSRKAWGLLALFVISGALFLMPACGNTTTAITTPNGTTPSNTYTFTVQGVDTDGVISSNTGSTTTNPSVSLTVTTPPH